MRNDLNGEPMNGTLHFVYLETDHLMVDKDNPDKCNGLVEKLAWSVKYMEEVKERPKTFSEEMMVKLYRNSEIANMTEEQQELVYSEFEEDLRRSAELATAERKGEKKTEKRVARALLAKGMSAAEIAEVTELSVEEVAKLRP